VLEFIFAVLNLWSRWIIYIIFLKTFDLPNPNSPAWIASVSLSSLNFSQTLAICVANSAACAIVCSVLKLAASTHGEMAVVQLRLGIAEKLLLRKEQSYSIDPHTAADLLGPKAQQIRQYLGVDRWWQEVCLIRFLLATFAAMILSWQVCLLLLAVVFVLACRIVFEMKVVQKEWDEYDSSLSSWLRLLLDVIGGTDLVVLSGSGPKEVSNLKEKSRDLLLMFRKVLPKSIGGITSAALVINFLVPAVFVIARLTKGDFHTFFLIISLLTDAQGGYDNYTTLFGSQSDYIRAQRAINNALGTLTDNIPEHEDFEEESTMEVEAAELQDIASAPEQKDQGIVLKNVQLGYIDSSPSTEVKFKTVIEANLTFSAGSVIGIIGESGSGKSTLLKAICGLIKPSKGDILVDGRSVFEDLDQWHSQISVIPQDCYLFNRTIYQNITFGNIQFSENDVQEAAQNALVLQFTSKLPGGLQAMVETGGKNLSGGQKQRVHIARTILKHSKYLILDEPVRLSPIPTRSH
jgi:ABC-type multidrug transport system fused ATPase/permease subunit